nr:transposase, MuDR, MULE transposase domain protein [Tanacetum cinerariifolium]
LAHGIPLDVEDPIQPALANSYSCDENVLDVFYNGCFLIYPLKYGGEALELKLSKVNKDVKKMYEMANLHGLIEVYVSHSPQLLVSDYYLKNLCIDKSDDKVTSQLKSHQKIKKDIDSYLLEEMIAWEQKESQSPYYLISPNSLKAKRLGIDLKGKSLLNDFESVEANFMKLFFNQHIVEDKLFAKVFRDQANDLRSRLTKMNQIKREMEAKEDQDAVFDSLDGLMDTIKRDSNVLVVVTQLQELVKNGIRKKENNVDFMNLADQTYERSSGGAALTELMQLSGETKIANFMKLFFNQHIVEDKLFAKVFRDQANDLRSRLTKMNQIKREMEAKEDQDAVFDSLDGLMDTIKRDSNVLVVVTQLQELVKNGIRKKENNVDFMNLADQTYERSSGCFVLLIIRYYGSS